MEASMKATQTNRKESKHDRWVISNGKWVQPTKIVPLQGTNNIVIKEV